MSNGMNLDEMPCRNCGAAGSIEDRAECVKRYIAISMATPVRVLDGWVVAVPTDGPEKVEIQWVSFPFDSRQEARQYITDERERLLREAVRKSRMG